MYGQVSWSDGKVIIFDAATTAKESFNLRLPSDWPRHAVPEDTYMHKVQHRGDEARYASRR